MNLDILVNQTACFYYWIQAVSGWDLHSIDEKTFRYYTNNLISGHRPACDEIRSILLSAKEPRRVLAELYSGSSKSSEAKQIEVIAKPLMTAFKPIWQECLPHLEKWQSDLESTDFTTFTQPMKEIAAFLDSDFSLEASRILYLAPNPPGHSAVGLAINETDFILVRPSHAGKPTELSNTLSVIAHEYVHVIEQHSKSSRELFKASYDKYIHANDVSAPDGYTWKMMYIEAVVYCFASTVIRGCLSQETYNKPRPTIKEMEDGFQRLIRGNNHTTLDIVNWIALNILPEVEKYIKRGKCIDQHFVDKMSVLFSKHYLT